jgi:DinB superfamily
MDVRSALKSQYHAALKTLHEVIEKCPEEMWNDPATRSAPFWRVVYHTLFYAHFYLQQTQETFRPWARHREEAQYISSVPREGHRPPKDCEPFTRDDLLEYCNECDDMIDAGVDALDLSAAQCGFPWYEMPTLEHQIVNIRHIQHHAAALASRLRRSAGIGVSWVGKG